jgi:hypothetical protein
MHVHQIKVMEMGIGNSDLSYILTTGASANALLSDSRFDEIAIKAVYAVGFEPEQSSLNNLVACLHARLLNPGGISLIDREVPAQGLGTYSNEEVRVVEVILELNSVRVQHEPYLCSLPKSLMKAILGIDWYWVPHIKILL